MSTIVTLRLYTGLVLPTFPVEIVGSWRSSNCVQILCFFGLLGLLD